jgi:hypothetical protein
MAALHVGARLGSAYLIETDTLAKHAEWTAIQSIT